MMARATATVREDRGGFALVEVMLALTLIAILATLALPGLVRATGPAVLRVAAFQVAALLREDRNAAQSGGTTIATRIDSAAGRVMAGASSASVGIPSGARVGVRDARMPIIDFYADGRSSGGEIVIASSSLRYVVTVNRDTGAIRVGEP